MIKTLKEFLPTKPVLQRILERIVRSKEKDKYTQDGIGNSPRTVNQKRSKKCTKQQNDRN